MAKPKPIEGLNCEAELIESAIKVLRVRFSEMLDFREAVLSPDGIDGVHDMRVASRRLRSALRDFSDYFKKSERKQFAKRLKRFADALGDVRDEDVAIIALRQILEQQEPESDPSEIDKLIIDRQIARECNRVELVELLSEEFVADLEQYFEKTIQSPRTVQNGLTF